MTAVVVQWQVTEIDQYKEIHVSFVILELTDMSNK